MQKMGKSHSIALCGVFGALCLLCMLAGTALPFATFCAPALAGLLLLPISLECGLKMAFVLYVAVGLLCLLLLPDVEMSAMFVAFLGYYPLIKPFLDCVRFRPLRAVCKLAVFNSAVIACYAVLMLVFPVQMLVDDFSACGTGMLAVLLLMGNVAFVIYDFAVLSARNVYEFRLRPRLRRLF